MIHPHDWEQLGLDAPTADLAVVRRAYSARLRGTRPDDDAHAYQRLRESYDRVTAALRARPGAQDHAATDTSESPSARGTVPAPRSAAAEDAAPSGPSASPDQLLASLHRVLRAEGEAAAVAALPALCAALEHLPLSARVSASARFADWVIANDDLPVSVLRPLSDHFDWTAADYRVLRHLGTRRATALSEAIRRSAALPEATPRPVAPQEPPPQPTPLPERTLGDLEIVGRLLGSRRLFRAWWAATFLPTLRPATVRQAGSETLSARGVPSHALGRMEGFVAIGVMTRVLMLTLVTVLVCGMDTTPWHAVGVALAAIVVARIAEQLLAALVLLTPPPPGRRDIAARWGLVLLLAAAGVAVPAQLDDRPGLMVIPAVAGAFGLMLSMPRRADAGLPALMLATCIMVIVPGWPVAPLLLVIVWVLGAAHLADGPEAARWRSAWSGGGALSRLGMLLRAAPAGLPLVCIAVVRRWGLIPLRTAAMLTILLHAVLPAEVATTGWRLAWLMGILAALLAVRVSGEYIVRRAATT